jgi:hypothetical protein
MNIGVSTTPWGRVSFAVRALPLCASTSKERAGEVEDGKAPDGDAIVYAVEFCD